MSRTRHAPDPYATFAGVYDLPDHAEITRAFLARALPEIRARRRGTAVLDLACGTGLFGELLSKRRVRVVGVDRSPEMLAIARTRRAPGAVWIEGDLRDFELDVECTVATACGDIVNHFPSLRALGPVLRHVARITPPDCTLLLETTRRFCYERYWDDRTWFVEGERGDVVMECAWDPARAEATARMTGYARGSDGRFEKVEIHLTEHWHDEDAIEAALVAAGWGRVERELWSPWDDQHLEPEYDRTFWTARKS